MNNKVVIALEVVLSICALWLLGVFIDEIRFNGANLLIVLCAVSTLALYTVLLCRHSYLLGERLGHVVRV